jgi:hypothetical protein
MECADNFSTYRELRTKYPCFIYDSYRYEFNGETLKITYSFSIADEFQFNPVICIPIKQEFFRGSDRLSGKELDHLVFHAGMIELLSYWKAACPPNVIIRPYKLSETQLKFWKKLYYNGLGEFFYINSIETDEEKFMEITCESDIPAEPFVFTDNTGCLVPVGGGKDSAVTMGLLENSGIDWVPFSINPGKTARDVIAAAGRGSSETLEISRKIDPLLLELNSAGFLNGHTPFSAALAFYTLIIAYLSGRPDILLSNESSANEATVPGTNINHQYSKTLEFEKDFRDYTRNYLSPGFNYFSMLRPLSELQIASLFSRMPQFHWQFKSCNVGSKTDSWCCNCPKCLFTFVILSPFLEPGKLESIFGRNLLDDPGLEFIFRQLAGREEIKPFECIGTIDEVNLALGRAIKMYPEGNLPYLLRLFRQEWYEEIPDKLWKAALNMTAEHCVPEKYYTLIERKR